MEPRTHPGQIIVRKLAERRHSFRAREGRSQLIELDGGSDSISRALRRKRGDKVFNFECFIWQRPAGCVPGRVRDVPAFGDKSEKGASKTEFSLNRVVSEIVERKESRMLIVLPLPRRRAIGSNAFKDGATVSALGKLNLQGAALSKPPKP